MKSILTLFTALLLAPSAGHTAETPLGDAAAVWHFGEAEDSQQRHPLTVRGAVQLGVALTGDDLPMEPTGPRVWHDVVVRGSGAKLELWLDGVLLDEEFPIGTTRPATASRFFGAAQLADGKLLAGFRGLMDHAALWHRALSEAEIVALSGGTDWARQRELAILSAPPEQMQYYRPRGYNAKAGADTMKSAPSPASSISSASYCRWK